MPYFFIASTTLISHPYKKILKCPGFFCKEYSVISYWYKIWEYFSLCYLFKLLSPHLLATDAQDHCLWPCRQNRPRPQSGSIFCCPSPLGLVSYGARGGCSIGHQGRSLYRFFNCEVFNMQFLHKVIYSVGTDNPQSSSRLMRT